MPDAGNRGTIKPLAPDGNHRDAIRQVFGAFTFQDEPVSAAIDDRRDAVMVAAGRGDDDRHMVAASAQTIEQLRRAGLGKIDIQNRNIDATGGKGGFSGSAIMCTSGNFIAAGLQQGG